MGRDNGQEAYEYLIDLANKQGYVTFDEIMDCADDHDLPIQDFDWLSNSITSRGTLVYSEAPSSASATDEDEYDDFAQSDYEAVYNRIIELSPSLEPFVTGVRDIIPPQRHEIKQLKYQIVDGNEYARSRMIEMHLCIALRVALQRTEAFDKYYLFYDADLTDEISQALHDILRKAGIFGNVTLYSHRDDVTTEGNAMVVREDTGVSYSIKRPIPYNDFLKRISQQTSIPITAIHKSMYDFSMEKVVPEEYINEYSVANIVSAFTDWRIEKMQTRFKYARSTQPVRETALTYKDGTPRDVIKQGNVGAIFVEGTPSDKYLYDKIAFDSPLEKANIMTDIDEVVVYGKIPKSSVAIPTIVGENYSPDFMYVVKRKDGSKELNIVVETKLVENKSILRGIEDVKIKCAEAFFNQLTIDGYTVSFHTQLSNKKVKQIIEDIMN